MNSPNAANYHSFLDNIASSEGADNFDSVKELSRKYEICEILIAVLRNFLLNKEESLNPTFASLVILDLRKMIKVFEGAMLQGEDNTKELEPLIDHVVAAKDSLIRFKQVIKEASLAPKSGEERHELSWLSKCRKHLLKAQSFLQGQTGTTGVAIQSINASNYIEKLGFQSFLDTSQNLPTPSTDNNNAKQLPNRTTKETGLEDIGSRLLATHPTRKNTFDLTFNSFAPEIFDSVNSEILCPHIIEKHGSVAKFNTLTIRLKDKEIIKPGYPRAKKGEGEDEIETRVTQLMRDLKDARKYGEFVKYFFKNNPGIGQNIIQNNSS